MDRGPALEAGEGWREESSIEDQDEVVFENRAPGLRFLVSYHLTDPGPEQSVTVSTVVFYESVVGALHCTPVQQVHRRGVPFTVWRMTKTRTSRP